MTKDERMREITDLLEKGVRDLFNTERYAVYLKTMDRFHDYSFNNTLLIAAQNPDATLVAGYQAWRKKFNRQVRLGEKGIRIIAPVPAGGRKKKENGEEPGPEDEKEKKSCGIAGFRMTTVFDISQTDGEPLPEMPGCETLTAPVQDYGVFMDALTASAGVPVRFEDLTGTANGYYDATAKEIVIRKGMSESQTVKTAVHETAHARLHDPDRAPGGRKDQVAREVEAESVAFMVCAHFGIDTSGYTFPYVAAWSSSVEMKELRSSMETIRHAAIELVDQLTEKMRELTENAAWEQALLFGTPALFCPEGHMPEYRVPEGLRRFELKGTEMAPDVPATLEDRAVYAPAGTLLTALPLSLPERGFLRLGGGFERTGKRTSAPAYKRSMEQEDTDGLGWNLQNGLIRENEELLWNGDKTGRYGIYRVRDDRVPYRRKNTAYVKEHDLKVKGSDYKLLCGGLLETEERVANLFLRFNMRPPMGYTGGNLMVSDVILVSREGAGTAFYIDSDGFTTLPGFISERAAARLTEQALNGAGKEES
ncbi:MAG: YodL domain-containing protein [Oscillospiraceae bacterium]|nr:YodL domain-containing protein [Oscillospiraceae bacterium]